MFTIANIAQSFINNSQSLFCVLLFRCCCRSRLSLRRFNMRTARIQFSLRPSILLYTSIGNTHAHTHTHTHTHTHCLSLTSFRLLFLLHFLSSDPGLQVRACNLLGGFLTSNKDPNLKYLSLEGLCSLATSEFSHEAVKKHQDTVLHALKVRDKHCYAF